jgi:hypothetical protein
MFKKEVFEQAMGLDTHSAIYRRVAAWAVNFKDPTQYCSFSNHQDQTFASNVGASVAELGALLAVQ